MIQKIIKESYIFLRYLILYLLIITSVVGAKDDPPKKWLMDGNAVVISDENIFRITGKNTGIYKKHVVLRVNNDKGTDFGRIVIVENSFIECVEISGTVKDTNLVIIEELDDDNIIGSTLSPGYTLHSDAKNIIFTLIHNEFPYIVDYTYEMEYNNLYVWPDWYPQYTIPVLESSYKIILEYPIKFNMYSSNIDIEPEIRDQDDIKYYTWILDSIAKRNEEPFIHPRDKWPMKLLFTADEFSWEGYSGSFSSWKSLGKWYNLLIPGKYNLPEEAQVEVNELVKTLQTDKEKVCALYKYLQEKTRYVAIELGIGGIQPYSAAWVYENRYGDCKDLSTFMIALLKHVNITGYPAWINTRDDQSVIKGFPADYFNHVITCVPLKEDTIWLETTSDLYNTDEIGSTIEDRYVLLLKETGGEIVKTPSSHFTDNSWHGYLKGEIKPNGLFLFYAENKFSGNQKYYYKGNWQNKKKENFTNWLQRNMCTNLYGLSIKKYLFREELDVNRKYAMLNIYGTAEKFVRKTGRRLFFNANIFNRRTGTVFEKDEKRNYPIFFKYAYLDIDTVSIKLPYGYQLEAAPDTINLETSFAIYRSSFSLKDNNLIHIRYFAYKQKEIPVILYDDYIDFIKTVIKIDQMDYVFVKKR